MKPLFHHPAIAIIGAGPAGLIAAQTLAEAGHAVALYDRVPRFGRKFLMAGRGGLNLTHSEDVAAFLTRYGAPSIITEAVLAFPPQALRAWAEELGQNTIIGSSGRVFPRAMKASPLLRAMLTRLSGLGVTFFPRHTWQGWDEAGRLIFATPEGARHITPAATLLALGGASWPRLGADGGWVPLLAEKSIPVASLVASNTGVLVPWSSHMARHFGAPLKRIAFTLGEARVMGEAMLTRSGLEGGAVYALSRALRAAQPPVTLTIDLRPDWNAAALASRLAASRAGDSLANRLRKAGLSPVMIALLQEVSADSHIRLGTLTPDALAARIKAVPLTISGLCGLDRAISSAGGIQHEAIDTGFMLKNMPGVFVAGEMLDWDAPTGGYLLQACFSTGIAAAKGMMDFLARQ